MIKDIKVNVKKEVHTFKSLNQGDIFKLPNYDSIYMKLGPTMDVRNTANLMSGYLFETSADAEIIPFSKATITLDE